ncbi:hypothetical protein F5Y18DRAFT_405099 [Xylariaceae sp. FL1019]|nr:hypothetical protein F5Y18DRAFT_405099 [Xylariaceae sp. FL1019]
MAFRLTISARAPYLFWTGTLPGVSSRMPADPPDHLHHHHHHYRTTFQNFSHFGGIWDISVTCHVHQLRAVFACIPSSIP